jgi:hypothetical protein
MNVEPKIAAIEPLLRAEGFSVSELCRTAEISQATWVRWKQGKPARGSAWRRIAPALTRLGIAGAAEIASRPFVEIERAA